METKVVIGISGGSGSGKTTFARSLHQLLAGEANLIYQDSYYKDQSHKFDHDGGSVNFDHPDAIDFDLMIDHIDQLRCGHSVSVPIYDFATHCRRSETQIFSPKHFLIIDGILIFSKSELFQRFDHTVFVQTNEDLRFHRRLKRDVEERGREPSGVRTQFYRQVKPMHDQFVEPTQSKADLIISGEQDFTDALENFVLSKLSR